MTHRRIVGASSIYQPCVTTTSFRLFTVSEKEQSEYCPIGQKRGHKPVTYVNTACWLISSHDVKDQIGCEYYSVDR